MELRGRRGGGWGVEGEMGDPPDVTELAAALHTFCARFLNRGTADTSGRLVRQLLELAWVAVGMGTISTGSYGHAGGGAAIGGALLSAIAALLLAITALAVLSLWRRRQRTSSSACAKPKAD